jgi:hypothetical protein
MRNTILNLLLVIDVPFQDAIAARASRCSLGYGAEISHSSGVKLLDYRTIEDGPPLVKSNVQITVFVILEIVAGELGINTLVESLSRCRRLKPSSLLVVQMQPLVCSGTLIVAR